MFLGVSVSLPIPLGCTGLYSYKVCGVVPSSAHVPRSGRHPRPPTARQYFEANWLKSFHSMALIS